ncbi:putative virulence protein, RhuM family [Campylobacter pinnipediorum subsp. caledonicus]|uniref:RhuM family protein n=1 Tax=Campylobacter pinnipediorum TaxID=1965231 RepID=UPI0009949A91|nr:RhuM family protein [Campylobacter pinnipediorum]AQW85595.1 putative virulence protein, RhuM family [Campylobacter pinnipediorum subsp. caledonicus]
MIDVTKQNFIMYSVEDKDINIQILADSKNETIWLNQKQIAEIFDTDRSGITKHITNIYENQELEEKSTCELFAQVRKDGTSINVKHYNLDMIIAIGYRVNSKKATKFRIWATKTLKEYLTKGFILDKERLKQGNNIFNKDYLDELIEQIREIRASEKMFYQKIQAVYALSIDYDKSSELAKNFFAFAQMKLEYAITHQTSAEIISQRVDHTKEHLGLTSWSGSKYGKEPIKKDVSVAKNYLKEDEIKNLNRLTTMLLDYVENQVKQGKVFTMSDWVVKLDSFLEFNGYDVLDDFGKIKSQKAKDKAELEYQKFQELKQTQYIEELENKTKD